MISPRPTEDQWATLASSRTAEAKRKPTRMNNCSTPSVQLTASSTLDKTANSYIWRSRVFGYWKDDSSVKSTMKKVSIASRSHPTSLVVATIFNSFIGISFHSTQGSKLQPNPALFRRCTHLLHHSKLQRHFKLFNWDRQILCKPFIETHSVRVS